VLAPVQALAGLEFTLEVGVRRLRVYHLDQKRRFAAMLEGRGLRALGAGADHGAFLTVVHPRAAQISQRLLVHGVKTDARGEYLRLCADLLNMDEELQRAAGALAVIARST
jgi:kynureninase